MKIAKWQNRLKLKAIVASSLGCLICAPFHSHSFTLPLRPIPFAISVDVTNRLWNIKNPSRNDDEQTQRTLNYFCFESSFFTSVLYNRHKKKVFHSFSGLDFCPCKCICILFAQKLWFQLDCLFRIAFYTRRICAWFVFIFLLNMLISIAPCKMASAVKISLCLLLDPIQCYCFFHFPSALVPLVRFQMKSV